MRKLLTTAGLSLVLGCPLYADPLPVLDAPERSRWAAVGQLNKSGYNTRAQCTGTLIAPDLVLTAAHCVGAPSGWKAKAADVHYVAGWDRGEFTYHGRAADVRFHPAYLSSKGLRQVGFDMAIVELTKPVPDSAVTPVPVTQTVSDRGDFALMAYQTSRPHMLNGRFDCAHHTNGSNIFAVGCEVTGGNSGGAALRHIDGTWHLAGVITARAEPLGEDVAYIARLNQWVFDEIEASFARHGS